MPAIKIYVQNSTFDVQFIPPARYKVGWCWLRSIPERNLIVFDGDTHNVLITVSFWNTCNEIRSPEIGKWLKDHKALNWQKGKPTKLQVFHIKNNKFEVILASELGAQ